ncbi:MAG: hypothetical protein CL944_01920 [Candidatus Diapherotrites archaeon]|uniref:GNAT family N-acetyltransferase n=1 Tax=Candidatus Iainarchaeum sp. TaxID=3101447 RepID=A0A2D6LPU8_9ARCH|nr:hypothetical protein [Candidatus Diapherotrites archaeon]
MTENENIRIVDAADKYTNSILELLNEDSEIISREYWEWKYLTPVVAKKLAIIAVNKKNEVVGHSGSIAQFIQINNKKYVGLKGEDVKTKKEETEKGIFGKIIKEGINRAEKQKLILYGFPNKLGKTVLKKFGLREEGKIFNFLKIFPKNQQSNKIKLIKVNKPIEDINIIWNKFKHEKVCVIRDLEFFKWRFFEKPNNNYNVFIAYKKNGPIGYIVVEKYRFGISIIDFISVGYHKEILNAMVNYYSKEPVFYLEGYFTDNLIISKLREMGFIKMPFSEIPLMVSCFIPKIKKAGILNTKNWFLTKADIEL